MCILLCTIVTCFHLSSSSHTDASPVAQPSLKVMPQKPQLSCTWPLSQQLISWFFFTWKNTGFWRTAQKQICHPKQQYYNKQYGTHFKYSQCRVTLKYTYIVLNSSKNTWIFKRHYLSQCSLLFLTAWNYNYASCLKLFTPAPSNLVLSLLKNSSEI